MTTTDRLQRLLPLLPLAAALWLLGEVGYTWLLRLTHPYDLEWMEGGMLAHAWRLQHGQPLYVTPSPDFMPMIYPPGYPALLAVLGWLPGLSHGLGRFVSVAGTVAAASAMVWGFRRHTGQTVWGIVAAAVWIGLYPRSGAFYDLVRPDALHNGLLAWATVLTLENDRRSLRAAGLLLCASFIVKHNAAIYGFPLTLGLLARVGWRPALTFAAWAAVPALVFTGLVQTLSGGLFTVWLLDVPASHPVVDDRIVPGTLREIGHGAGIATAGIAAWLLTLTPNLGPRMPTAAAVLVPMAAAVIAVNVLTGLPPVNGIERPEAWESWSIGALCGIAFVALPLQLLGMALRGRIDGMWVTATGVTGVAVVTTALMRGHHGGFINVFMYLHWLWAALFGLGLLAAIRALPGLPGVALASVVATAQLGLLASRMEPDRFTPDAGDRAAGDAVVARLRDAPGPILSPFNPWLAAQAGHEPGWHLIALWDIRHREGPFQPDVKALLDAINHGYYGTIVDSDEGAKLGFQTAYRKAHVFQSARSIFTPRTGWRARPNVIWTRKEAGDRQTPEEPAEREDEAVDPAADEG